ncbi:CpsB/CapC family capsule biosynthesis tyrosine phosphatase [Nitratifractor sp.]|uniref:tyrosine-protein phosphatase n=1 Tax=Nitratifractor sp. TaxID=2268144 RepID=UPI0025DEE908|nr:CpsB/CapC family capsule biosynthesis tyrosine phosphatase [Nitratifractor sp.]
MIRSFFRRKKTQREEPVVEYTPDRLPLSTDIHSHLIPGIDDGSPDLETSLKLIEGLGALGYRRLITTPHVMADSYRNSSETIRQGAEKLREALDQKGISIEIKAAAEYYLDEEFLRRLEREDILTIGDRMVLFETSYYNEPLSFEKQVYEISARGYQPLLAHPERYRYVEDPETFYGRLREMGVSFQVNINSLGGYYGREAAQKALWLGEKGWIDYLGSDLHTVKQLEFLEKSLGLEKFYQLVSINPIKNDKM